jgi:putative PIN family toxin of toxin-antitoxin system
VTQRVVLDTNVWLDWLVFADPGISALREAVSAGRAELWIDEPCAAELVRVLAYPLGRFTLDAAAQAKALAEALALAKRWEDPARDASLPLCRDADDQKFLALAAACGAQVLVTKDLELLRLAKRVPFRILVPAAFASVG